MAALSQMKKEDLVEYARDQFGYLFPPEATREQMLATIHGLKNTESSPIVEPDAPYETPPPGSKADVAETAKHIRAYPRVKIIIHEQDGDEGRHDVKVGVNGVVFNIKRGFEVDVPTPVLQVIKDAVITKFERDEDSGEIVERDINRFNYTVLGPV